MADTPFIAKAYIDAGWAVVPLVKGEKRASSSWQKKIYTPKDFGVDDGIAGKCGEPSGWRVDVDLDSTEAVAAAKILLPNTGLIHGRPGKPDSHYWFLCDGIKTSQFTDIKDSSGKHGMLVEVRSSGGYTALPPSGHPSGDVLAWTIERDPLRITPEDLYASVRTVAITALLARHWPGSGARHAMVGHLAGFLLQAGLKGLMVETIIRTAATLAGDQDLNDRLTLTRTTIGKFTAGENVTGGPKLTEQIGDELVNRMRAWLKLKDEDAIEAMNTKHFVVTMGKDCVIGREDMPGGVIFQQTRALYTEYANVKIAVGEDKKGNQEFKPLFQEWLEHKSRRKYREVVFEPPPLVSDAQDYNLWKGFALEPKAGDCQRFLDHLFTIICSGDGENFLYLTNLLAQLVQQPGIPSGIATALRGEPGTGKSHFVQSLMDMFGHRHTAHLDKVEQITGKFNSALSGKVLVFADEALFAGDKRDSGALKRLITERTLLIERKGFDSIHERNCVHLFMATNHARSFPSMMKERRLFALEVSNAKIQDAKYFGELVEYLKAGGLAAFLAWLLEQPVDMTLLRQAPKNAELLQQQDESLEPHMEWWKECLESGRIGQLGWPDSTWTPVDVVFEVYRSWMGLNQHKWLLGQASFGMRMKGLLFTGLTKTAKINGEHRRCGMVLKLKDARDAFDARTGLARAWDDLEVETLPQF